MTAGFIGMIFGFFIAFFGASLVVPSDLMKMIRRMKGRVVKQEGGDHEFRSKRLQGKYGCFCEGR
jgi:hypothetical protein